MALVFSHNLMGKGMRDSTSTTSKKVLVSKHGQTVTNITVSGVKTRWKVKEYSNGLMEGALKESLKMTWRMEKESSIRLMVNPKEANGTKVNLSNTL